MFLDCIKGSKNVYASRVADKARRDTATTEQVSVGNLFSAPRRKKKRVPRARNPIESDSDDEDGPLGGAGLPSTYREFVKAMLPHVRAKGLAPQAAMKTVAMMWRKHKGQRGAGLTLSGSGLALTGTQQGMGFASSLSSGAKGTAAALGLAGLAQPELAPILEHKTNALQAMQCTIVGVTSATVTMKDQTQCIRSARTVDLVCPVQNCDT